MKREKKKSLKQKISNFINIEFQVDKFEKKLGEEEEKNVLISPQ